MASRKRVDRSSVAQPHASNRPSSPDLVLLNGRVYISSADPARRFAQAVAISADRILAVGTSSEIAAMADAHTRRVELNERVVIPGFNDAHFHHTPDPRATRLATSFEPTWEEVLDALAAAVKEAPSGSWILGTHGIQVVNDPRATRFELDRIAPNHPVRSNCYFGHGTLVNTRAMAALAMSEEEPDPLGGCCERAAGTNRITGKLFGYAQWGPWRRLADTASISEAVADARQLAQEAIRFGITSMQNMSLLGSDRYVEVLQQAKLPLRVRVIRFPQTGPDRRDVNEGRGLSEHPGDTGLITVSGTKWLLDGTPLERRAALRTEYRDRKGWSGQFYLPEREMRAMLRESLEDDDPLLVHAVGDKTVETFLNALEAEGADWENRRIRIEHGDGLLPDLIPRARDLGIVVVQNPSHFAFKDIFVARYGERFDYAPARSLIEAGIPFALGSDGPMNPYLNLMFAVTHPGRRSEAISREQAVDAYTIGSAFAEFQEDEKGSISPGKLADLAVLSQDIFRVPVDYIPATTSVLTMIGGEIVYDSGTLAVPN
jgi:predicted amidohydrolase YtcJ